MNSCGSAARSGWVRRGTTTLVGAMWPGTEGELLRLSGPQWVGTEGNDDPGRGAGPGTEGELLRLSGPQWVRDERVGVGAGPTQMSGSETQRSRPKTHFLASRGRLEIKECPD